MKNMKQVIPPKPMMKLLFISVLASSNVAYAAPAEILFQENFEDSNLTSRGWYDNTNIQLSTVEHVPGSISSAEFYFPQGSTTPTSGGAIRKTFTATEEVYLSYYVKYSSNWTGSDQPYHPHEFLFLTNLDGDWNGLSDTHMTAYVEHNEGVPVVSLQDSQNIDENNINVDLTNISENRAVTGCNGAPNTGYTRVDCYTYGDGHRNEIVWKASMPYFQDTQGQYYKNDWHKIEVRLKMNSIQNNKGMADGIIQYWYDGELIINHSNVMFRTAQYPNMMFDMLAIAPYIGDGSPISQTMWVDNLVIGSGYLGVRPLPPSNVTAQ